MNAKTLTIQPAKGGFLSGELLVALELSSGAFSLNPLLLAEKLVELCRLYRTRFVLLEGYLTGEENLDTQDLLQALLARSIVPVLFLSGQEAPVWMSLCETRIVFLRSPDWLEYPVTEIQYIPKELIDPSLKPFHASCSFVLDLRNSSFPKAEVLSYLTTSKIHWKLYTSPVTTFRMDETAILRKLEEDYHA